MQIDDKAAHYNGNPWSRFGFRWSKEEKAEIERNLDRFLEKAGATYKVEKESTHRPDGQPDGRYNLVRSDTRAVVGSKAVTGRYVPLCPTDLAAALAPLVEQGWATPDAFFTMGNGVKEVLVCRLDAGQLPGIDEDIDGSDRIFYLSLRNSHGLGQASGSLHSFRVICENTEAAAAASWSWKVRHTGDPAERVRQAVEAWEGVKVQTRKLAERFKLYAQAPCSLSDAKGFAHAILELDPAAVAMREDRGSPFFGKQLPGASTAGVNLRDEILSAFNRPSKGTYGKTLQDLRNGVTDTMSHWTRQGSRQDARKVAEQHLDIGGTRWTIERRTDEVLAAALGLELETVAAE